MWRGEAQPTCVGAWGLSLVSWVERCDPTPVPSFPRAQQGSMNEGEHSNPEPDTSKHHDNKGATYMPETTTGHVFQNSRSRWTALCHGPGISSALCCCACSQAKGPLGRPPPSDCFLAPITNGLLYHLPGASLSTHTNSKGLSLHISLRST